MSIEKELLKPIKGIKSRNRQIHLLALVSLWKFIPDTGFDKLPQEAADWLNNAVRAIKNKEEIPDPKNSSENDGK